MEFEDFLAEDTTLAQLNKALKAAHLNLEIVRGKGYFYFTGKDAEQMSEQGIYAWNILKAKPQEVVDEAKLRMTEN